MTQSPQLTADRLLLAAKRRGLQPFEQLVDLHLFVSSDAFVLAGFDLGLAVTFLVVLVRVVDPRGLFALLLYSTSVPF